MKSIIKKLLITLTLGIIALVGGFLLPQPAEAAVGDTIAQTFPDTHLSSSCSQ